MNTTLTTDSLHLNLHICQVDEKAYQLFSDLVVFSSVYRYEIFAYNRNSIFTLLTLNMGDEISSQFNELKFQPRLKFSTI